MDILKDKPLFGNGYLEFSSWNERKKMFGKLRSNTLDQIVDVRVFSQKSPYFCCCELSNSGFQQIEIALLIPTDLKQ